MQDSNQILVQVYSPQNKALFLVAKSMLDDAGIEYFTKGENLDLAYGGELVIEVKQDNLDEAKEILRDFIDGNQEVSENPEHKKLYKQKSEFNYALTIGTICLIILLTLIAAIFVKC